MIINKKYFYTLLFLPLFSAEAAIIHFNNEFDQPIKVIIKAPHHLTEAEVPAKQMFDVEIKKTTETKAKNLISMPFFGNKQINLGMKKNINGVKVELISSEKLNKYKIEGDFSNFDFIINNKGVVSWERDISKTPSFLRNHLAFIPSPRTNSSSSDLSER